MILNHEPIDLPCAWNSQDLHDQTAKWQYRLTDADNSEIEQALKQLQSLRLLEYRCQKSQFPLPTLGGKFEQICQMIERGLGVFLLRGLRLEGYSDDEIRLIYAGIGSHLGYLIPQNIEGQLIGDISGLSPLEKKIKEKIGQEGSTLSDPIPFHNDRADIVTLLCLCPAVRGGESKIVSAVSIHNEIQRTRPDLLARLYQPYYHAGAGWERDGQESFYSLPIFTQEQGHFAARLLRDFIDLAQGYAAVPKLDALGQEALDLLEQLAHDPRFCAHTALEPGDIQMINNFVIFHSRAGYVDNSSPQRHLLRLWISSPMSRPLSSQFSPLYGSTKAGAIRGGVLSLLHGGVAS